MYFILARVEDKDVLADFGIAIMSIYILNIISLYFFIKNITFSYMNY